MTRRNAPDLSIMLFSSMLSVFMAIATAQLTCKSEPIGCFGDFVDGKTRLLVNDYMSSSSTMTHQLCVEQCAAAGLPYAGVEYAQECHCGTGINPHATKVHLPDSKCNSTCTGDDTEKCGGTDAITLLNFTCTGKRIPNYKGCENKVSKSLPYCNTSLTVDQRVSWILANLTLDEKIAMISPQSSLGDVCGDHTSGKASIGLPNYFWLTEANSDVAAAW